MENSHRSQNKEKFFLGAFQILALVSVWCENRISWDVMAAYRAKRCAHDIQWTSILVKLFCIRHVWNTYTIHSSLVWWWWCFCRYTVHTHAHIHLWCSMLYTLHSARIQHPRYMQRIQFFDRTFFFSCRLLGAWRLAQHTNNGRNEMFKNIFYTIFGVRKWHVCANLS